MGENRERSDAMNKWKIASIAIIVLFVIYLRFIAWACTGLNDSFIFIVLFIHSVLASAIAFCSLSFWSHKENKKQNYTAENYHNKRRTELEIQSRPARNPNSFPRCPRK